MLKIEVLYFEGCPNYPLAVERVKTVLRDENVEADVVHVDVREVAVAREIGFLGSPTIRVNGLDVEPAARSSRDYGITCRTYMVGERREGLPALEMLRQAINDSRSSTGEKNSRSAPWIMASSVLAGILASFCCILPIVFAITGISTLGASALISGWRPYLLAATFVLLALGLYLRYRPRKHACALNPCCATATERTQMGLLWLGSIVAVVFAAFPYYSGPIAEFALQHAGAGVLAGRIALAKEATVTLKLPGMDCDACTVVIRHALTQTSGVKKVDLNVDKRLGTVVYDAAKVSVGQIQKAIEMSGFQAEPIRRQTNE